jgi:hypothetical protein
VSRSGCIVLTICFLLGQSVIAVLPEAASAEWTESSWPCDVAEGATLPGPILWREVGESIQAPVAYFTYGESPAHAPPTSDFTETANWGDGTTSSARVESGSVGDCYVVSGPSHAYADVGTYRFSYAVHDLKTGADHELAAVGYPEFFIWSITPQLVGGPSSRAINAMVGVPWSGVVAEFNYTYKSPSSPYQAQIEWGDGEPPTTATVTPQSSELAFTVSGSHTYTRSLNGTVRVLLAYGVGWSKAGDPLGAWTTTTVDATSPPSVTAPQALLRFRGQSILAVVPRGLGAPLYEIFFQVNRPLPQARSGHIEATIEAHGRSSSVRRLTIHETSTCYAAIVSGSGRLKPKAGARYPFTLVLGGGTATRDSGYGLVRRFASIGRMQSAARRLLGCS